MQKKLTVKMIAKELDLSISSVSKALNDKSDISKETKNKVLKFARLYNYRPNLLAIRLKKGKVMNIGIIIPNLSHDFFFRIIQGIENIIKSHGYSLVIWHSNESIKEEKKGLELFSSGTVDGTIISFCLETLLLKDFSEIKNVLEFKHPLVVFDRMIDEPLRVDVITNDNEKGAYDAVEYLIKDTKRKRVAIFSLPIKIGIFNERYRGYCNALKAFNIEIEEGLILELSGMSDYENEIEVFFKNKTFDAVFCTVDIFAVKALNVARDFGLSIPKDIAIIGFSNGMMSQLVYPKLTTVSQNAYRMGQKAAKTVLKQINKTSQKSPKLRYVKTSLIVREST